MNEKTTRDGLGGSVTNWFAHPFNSDGSALNWVLFLGLAVIALWFWNHILLQLQGKV